ncbi:uroporphyrinogen-III synthase [Roseicyclus sp.]|uniref:uroporphyrinogen-III synthase n=1 Tax=Roseicyclus sp. TaxID=1914329 RepID=UPI003F6B1717
MSDNAAAFPPLILLTRPRAASAQFAEALHKALGPVAVSIAPLMEIVPQGDVPDLDVAAGLIFTSAAGVDVFAAKSARRDLPAWCVGARTAAAAAAIGLTAHSAEGDAEALVALLSHAAPRGRLVHLCGIHQRGDVAARLCAAGLQAVAAPIYDQRAVAPDAVFAAALSHPGPVIVPLFSPRSATLFAQAASHAPVMPVVLSDAVRAALPPAMAARAHVAAQPDAPAMIRAMAAVISPHSAA